MGVVEKSGFLEYLLEYSRNIGKHTDVPRDWKS